MIQVTLDQKKVNNATHNKARSFKGNNWSIIHKNITEYYDPPINNNPTKNPILKRSSPKQTKPNLRKITQRSKQKRKFLRNSNYLIVFQFVRILRRKLFDFNVHCIQQFQFSTKSHWSQNPNTLFIRINYN